MPGLCSGSLQRSFLRALSLLENWKTTTELAQSTLRYSFLPGLVWVRDIGEARRGKWGVFAWILHVLGFCCLCPALMSFEVPSFRLIKIKTMGDLSCRTFPSGVFSLRPSCSSSGTGNTRSYKIAVLMKSQVLMVMETKTNLLLFSSMTIPSLYFWIFLIHFHFKRYKFSGSVLSPSVV